MKEAAARKRKKPRREGRRGDASAAGSGKRTGLRKRERNFARDIYVDLLINTLTGTVLEDPAINPGNKGTFDPKLRRAGRDWPGKAASMAGVLRLSSLAQLVQSCLDDRIPGHFIETGVWRGGACILMRGVLAANGVKKRRVFVADSFAGLPPPEVAEDAGDKLYTMPELAVSKADVRKNFARFNLLDEQVVFVEGWFKDTLPKLRPKRFALIRLDGDMYASTTVALENLYPKLSPGGYCVIDDYALETCRRAVSDFRSARGIEAPLEQVDWTGVWWRKPGGPGMDGSQAGSPA